MVNLLAKSYVYDSDTNAFRYAGSSPAADGALLMPGLKACGFAEEELYAMAYVELFSGHHIAPVVNPNNTDEILEQADPVIVVPVIEAGHGNGNSLPGYGIKIREEVDAEGVIHSVWIDQDGNGNWFVREEALGTWSIVQGASVQETEDALIVRMQDPVCVGVADYQVVSKGFAITTMPEDFYRDVLVPAVSNASFSTDGIGNISGSEYGVFNVLDDEKPPRLGRGQGFSGP
mgnify:CR=1 FL=1